MDKLIINGKKQVILVDFIDILSLNASGRYTQVITLSRKYLSCKNLGLLELGLPDYFFRIHNSHIINVRKILSIDGNMVNMENGVTYKIANNRTKKFKEHIKNLCNRK